METSNTGVAQPGIYQGRYGFYPVDYAHYKMLKDLNKKFEAARTQLATWQRWNNKAPQNRVTRKTVRNAAGQKISSYIVGPRPEPPLHAVLTRKYKMIDRNSSATRIVPREDASPACVALNLRRDEWAYEGPILEQAELTYTTIAEDYRAARYPKGSPAEVVRTKLTPAAIEHLHGMVCLDGACPKCGDFQPLVTCNDLEKDQAD